MSNSVVDGGTSGAAPLAGRNRRMHITRLSGAILLGAPAVGVVELSFETPASATTDHTYVVNSLSGTLGGTGDCANPVPGGTCTLSNAVNQYDLDPSGSVDTIDFAVVGTFGLGAKFSPSLTLNNGNDVPLTIEGNGPQQTILDGTYTGPGSSGELLSINGNNGPVSISGVTMQNASFGGSGAAIQNVGTGTLTISDSVFKGNTAGYGGAIFSNGTLVVARSTFENNSATTANGGAVEDGGTATFTNVTFVSNSATQLGGALWVDPTGHDTLSFDTLSANTAGTDGGAIYDSSPSPVALTGDILAGNGSSPADNSPDNCALAGGAAIADNGGNVTDDGSCYVAGPGADVTDAAIGLQAVTVKQPSGLPVLPIPISSVAAGLVPAASCPATDEVGTARPQPGMTTCAAGAFEPVIGAPPPPLPAAPVCTATAGDSVVDLSWTAPVGPTPDVSFVVQRSTADAPVPVLTPLPGAATTFTDNTVTNGVTYTYEVVAVGYLGQQTASAPCTATPMAPTPTVPANPPPPNPPVLPVVPACAVTSGDVAWLCAVYQDLFGRALDQSGYATWNGLLMAGAGRTAVAVDLLHSAEWHMDLVSADYERFLGRAVDPSGMATWLAAIARGATDEDLVVGICGSEEYAGHHNPATVFVDALYQDLLGRAPDPGGLATMLILSASMTNDAAAVSAVVHSAEYRADLVNAFYERYLGRPADPGGLVTYGNQLASGAPDQTVIAELLASPEYAARHGI
ncbi:MAG TPA: DUF4214 domain-containing protein [Acidimicrobiales bacterium]|nr:DUF4214 domain-containing protein [Acidimicrobiales bacterium]